MVRARLAEFVPPATAWTPAAGDDVRAARGTARVAG